MANLGDVLAGAAGAPVNRPALNAYITQGQSMAGLRTAQTDAALTSAQAGQEKMAAWNDLETSLQKMGMPASQAMAVRQYAQASGHDPTEILNAYHNSIVGDPTADPNARLAAAQALAPGKVMPFQDVGNQLVPAFAPGTQTPGATPPVDQTPMSVATENNLNAQAGLHNAEAQHPQLFHPNTSLMTPEEIAAVVKYVKENPAAAPTGYALSRPNGAAIAAALSASGGTTPKPGAPNDGGTGTGIAPAPGVSFQEQAQIRSDFAHGIAARQISSLNTMFQHAQLFDQIADQLHNGNFTPTNHINVMWQKLFGSPAPTNLATAAAFLGREAIRATVNSGAGTGDERELQIGANASPEQLHGVAQTLRTLVGGQLHSLELRARRGGVDISHMISPEALQAYGLTPQQLNQAASPSGAAAGAAGNLPQNPLAAMALAELQRRQQAGAAAPGGAQ